MLTKPIMDGSGPPIDLSEVLAIEVRRATQEYGKAIDGVNLSIVFLFKSVDHEISWEYTIDKISKMDRVEQAVLDLINNQPLKEL